VTAATLNRYEAEALRLAAPGYLGVTRQASTIAARLRPEAKDLRMRAVVSTGENEGSGASARRVPASGYVGPYPLREREAGGGGGRVGATTRRSRSMGDLAPA
jgi:hypothetical protein